MSSGFLVAKNLTVDTKITFLRPVGGYGYIYKFTGNVTVSEVTWSVKYNIIIKFLVVDNPSLQTPRSPFQDFWLWR